MARTIAEQLDDAQSGDEFGQVLQRLFQALEVARDSEQIGPSKQ